MSTDKNGYYLSFNTEKTESDTRTILSLFDYDSAEQTYAIIYDNEPDYETRTERLKEFYFILKEYETDYQELKQIFCNLVKFATIS